MIKAVNMKPQKSKEVRIKSRMQSRREKNRKIKIRNKEREQRV